MVLVLIGDTGQVYLRNLFGLLQLMASRVVTKSNPRSDSTFKLAALGHSCVSDLAGHHSPSAAFHWGTNMVVQVAVSVQSAVKEARW